MTARPRVTVGVVVYNAAGTLRETLASLVVQTFDDFEVVVSDDASTDDSYLICEEYASNDTRFRLLRHKTNTGGIANLNVVAAEARGEYFVWLSDHDTWAPEYLACCVGELDSHPASILCHTGGSLIDQSGAVVRSLQSRLDTRGLNQQARLNVTMWSLQNGTVCVYGVQRVARLRNLVGFPMLYKNVLAPDVILLMELALLGETIYVDRALFHLREAMDVGDPAVYMAKLHLTPRSGIEGVRLFGRTLGSALRAVRYHVPGMMRQVAAGVSVGVFMAVDYGWLLRAAVLAGHRQRRG